jgi:hypothetical protein
MLVLENVDNIRSCLQFGPTSPNVADQRRNPNTEGFIRVDRSANMLQSRISAYNHALANLVIYTILLF